MTTLHVTKAVQDITGDHFEYLLEAGAFPEVKYEKHEHFRTYSLLDYSNRNAQYMKLLDGRIKEELGEPLGVFTRKRSATFLKALEGIVTSISAMDIINQTTRFRSFADAVMEEAMK